MTNKKTGEEFSVNIFEDFDGDEIEIKRARKEKREKKNWSESNRNFKIFDLQSFCIIFIIEYLNNYFLVKC